MSTGVQATLSPSYAPVPTAPDGSFNSAKTDHAAPQNRKRIIRRVLIIGTVAAASWAAGRSSSGGMAGERLFMSTSYGWDSVNGEACNPYAQPGVLNVDTAVPSLNAWQPLFAPPSCQPVDYMSALQSFQRNQATSNETVDIEFLRGRTVAIFGDSVDREHNDHFCGLIGGRFETIESSNELHPPYPPGQELPPEGYKSVISGEREWPNFSSSRPHVCHIEKLNFRILNVFHYGFEDATPALLNHGHYYPPSSVEDRFDQVLVPLMRGLAQKYGSSPIPDILSVSPGFWGIMWQTVQDARLLDLAIHAGEDPEVAKKKHDVWRSMNPKTRRFSEKRVADIVRHLAKGWKGEEKRPLMLWRALHFIKNKDSVPVTSSVALDRIGRSVVERLIDEGRAAEAGGRMWKAWGESFAAQSIGFQTEGREEVLEGGLGRRLKIDEWATLMLGHPQHLRDEIHPNPLPGSWLYGNMLLHSLRMKVAAERQL
ncbi:hypothetical protein JCM8547_003700 [Rhodosporidiobolus lusitaniae]